MCGIVAIFNQPDKAGERLLQALGKIAHRGTSQNEHMVFDHAAMGTNRLPIIAPKGGAQPKANEKNTIFGIMNGEIFNYAELSDTLKLYGHTISGQSDTETLVHLYEEYGQHCVQQLDSEMFAFVIYDKAKDVFFAARDALGVKPLYYAVARNGAFYLASEIKALVQFDDIDEVREFPAGHMCINGKFQKYATKPMAKPNSNIGFEFAKQRIQHLIVDAVQKRLPTNNLPLAVFLSGGVDSSLVMAITHKYHPDVTAFILGNDKSLDRDYAERLCKDMGWKHVVVSPDVDYAKELEQIVYYAESYEPNIIRHSFAQDLIAREAGALGYKVVLTSEGSDELFAGYNEFKSVPADQINRGCEMLLHSMSNGNLMRVDKLSMRHTIETRCPFFDRALIAASLALPGDYKVKHEGDKIITKHILREAVRDFLPGYIVDREKMAFANGAGMDIGENYTLSDGVLSQLAADQVSDQEFAQAVSSHHTQDFQTKEEVLLFGFYEKSGYTKFKSGGQRPIMKDTLVQSLAAEAQETKEETYA